MGYPIRRRGGRREGFVVIERREAERNGRSACLLLAAVSVCLNYLAHILRCFASHKRGEQLYEDLQHTRSILLPLRLSPVWLRVSYPRKAKLRRLELRTYCD